MYAKLSVLCCQQANVPNATDSLCVYEVHLLIVVSPDTEVTDGVTFSSECLVHRQKFSDRFWS